jgi:HSP20 family protein
MFPVLRRDYRRFGRDPFELMRRDLDRLFGYWPEMVETADITGEYPMDMREEDNKVIVDQELPGFRKNEIDVSIDRDVLSIVAERRPAEAKGTAHLRERRYTRVQRSVALPAGVDESKVDAKLQNGVLHLEMVKKEGAERRRIEVK